MTKRRLWVLLAALTLTFSACDDDAGKTTTGDTLGADSAGGDAEADAEDIGGEDTTTGDTGDGDTAEGDTAEGDTAEGDTAEGDTTTADADTSSGDTSSGDAAGDSADAVDSCTGGTLCGRPVTCCPAGNECINSSCLPTCESGVRCGAESSCCDVGQLCIADACATPGDACLDSYDCGPSQFCEPTLGQCLPQPDTVTCTIVPNFTELTTQVEWSFTGEEIISSPMVADLDGDELPEVVVNATRVGAADWGEGQIIILNGQTGDVIRRLGQRSHGRSTIALGDVSGDGNPDIIYASRGSSSRILAVDANDNLLWEATTPAGDVYLEPVVNGAATLANFDDDPEAEIVFGAVLIDHDGRVVWEGAGGAGAGTNNNYLGGISAVADLDGDGEPEIVSGHDAWDVSWTVGTPPTVEVTPMWTAPGADGYPAIADMDGNGTPEVVIVASGMVTVVNGETGALWCGVDPTGAACDGNDAARTQPLAIPGGGRGGPPTIADFDKDGRPEVGVAGGSSYSVYDFNRSGEVVVQPSGAAAPAEGAIFVRWSKTTKDQSSNATGSSVFDFQGDSSAEVVYADECYMRVYSGETGDTLVEIPNTSSTIHEYPVVVDVDADGNSEILIVANTADGNPAACPTNQGVRDGLYVYGDSNDEWVSTRRVWTQHAYHVTNATSRGNVPLVEEDNWALEGLNNYRQNVQGEGVFNAPDLAVSVSAALNLCGIGSIRLLARVTNVGSLGVAAGVPVTFYFGTDDTGAVLGTQTTTVPLLPGASTTVELNVDAPAFGDSYDFYVAVDDAGASASGELIAECDESNNDGTITDVYCVIN